jgi:hypothetical protein
MNTYSMCSESGMAPLFRYPFYGTFAVLPGPDEPSLPLQPKTTAILATSTAT